MTDDVLREANQRMEKTIELFRKNMASVRAGRATPALLDKVQVEYYGTLTPINQLANISVPEPRTLVLQPWDKTSIEAIEKAILKSDLGLIPNNDGNVIRLTIPQLTEERRNEIVRSIRKEAEDERVAIRNVRRECNDLLKQKEKNNELTQDEVRRLQERIQKLTDEKIAEIDEILAAKEKEILSI